MQHLNAGDAFGTLLSLPEYLHLHLRGRQIVGVILSRTVMNWLRTFARLDSMNVQENDYLHCRLEDYHWRQMCTITCNNFSTEEPTSLRYQGSCKIGPAVDHPVTNDCALCAWNGILRPIPFFLFEYSENNFTEIVFAEKFANYDELVAAVCSDLTECTDACVENVQENDFLSCGLTIDDQFQKFTFTCNGSPPVTEYPIPSAERPTEIPGVPNSPPLSTGEGENTSRAPTSFSNRKESLHLITFLVTAGAAVLVVWI